MKLMRLGILVEGWRDALQAVREEVRREEGGHYCCKAWVSFVHWLITITHTIELCSSKVNRQPARLAAEEAGLASES